MAKRSRSLRWVLAVVIIFGVVALALRWVRAPNLNAAERGAQAYQRLGCDGCHGPGGFGGIPNPRSKEREVPALIGGTAMMYIESPEEIREWILDGRPKRLSKSPAGEEALVHMPAYRDRIATEELEDLVAYYQAVGWYEPSMPEPAQEGRRIAAKKGCFGCHGPSGQVGVKNPGSFKGYIPGWGSADYFELVESQTELREWINEGVSKRFADDPLAQQFLAKQVIQMPAYKDVLSPQDIDSIVIYIQWLTKHH